MSEKIKLGYLILGKHESRKDLIKFGSKLYQPQVSINIEFGDEKTDTTDCVLYIDEQEGFAIKCEVSYKLVDAIIWDEAGKPSNITVSDARNFIIVNFNKFKPYKHISAHEMHI